MISHVLDEIWLSQNKAATLPCITRKETKFSFVSNQISRFKSLQRGKEKLFLKQGGLKFEVHPTERSMQECVRVNEFWDRSDPGTCSTWKFWRCDGVASQRSVSFSTLIIFDLTSRHWICVVDDKKVRVSAGPSHQQRSFSDFSVLDPDRRPPLSGDRNWNSWSDFLKITFLRLKFRLSWRKSFF